MNNTIRIWLCFKFIHGNIKFESSFHWKRWNNTFKYIKLGNEISVLLMDRYFQSDKNHYLLTVQGRYSQSKSLKTSIVCLISLLQSFFSVFFFIVEVNRFEMLRILLIYYQKSVISNMIFSLTFMISLLHVHYMAVCPICIMCSKTFLSISFKFFSRLFMKVWKCFVV